GVLDGARGGVGHHPAEFQLILSKAALAGGPQEERTDDGFLIHDRENEQGAEIEPEKLLQMRFHQIVRFHILDDDRFLLLDGRHHLGILDQVHGKHLQLLIVVGRHDEGPVLAVLLLHQQDGAADGGYYLGDAARDLEHHGMKVQRGGDGFQDAQDQLQFVPFLHDALHLDLSLPNLEDLVPEVEDRGIKERQDHQVLDRENRRLRSLDAAEEQVESAEDSRSEDH